MNHQWILKLVGESLMSNRRVRYVKISSTKYLLVSIVIMNFTVERLSRHHLNQLVKLVSLVRGQTRSHASWYDALSVEHGIPSAVFLPTMHQSWGNINASKLRDILQSKLICKFQKKLRSEKTILTNRSQWKDIRRTR